VELQSRSSLSIGFEPHENPIPENESGQYIWFEIKGVEIIEIVDYH